MGLFDSILGSALGAGGASASGGMADLLAGLLDKDGKHGGLDGLIARFNEAGLGDVVGSWIGKGSNLPISAEQLSAVLGSDALAGMAAKLGIDPAAASGTLSEILPGLIDQLTPHGDTSGVGQGGEGDLMGMLGGLLKNR